MRLFVFVIVLVTAFAVVAAEKEWTFMVFMNGDNNLSTAGYDDINEMKAGVNSTSINVVVQQDTSANKARRVVVTKGEIKVIEDMGAVDMGDWKQLSTFVNWTIQNYPAKKYVLVIWNHGSGWKTKEFPFTFKGVSYDDHSGNHITTPQLEQALAAVGTRINIVGFDACLMGMIEIAYEIKDHADFLVASEETEPFDGWPYDMILGHLSANPQMDAGMLAAGISKDYVDSYSNGSQGNSEATQGAVALAYLDPFLVDFNSFTDDLIAALPQYKAKIKEAFSKTQDFYYPEYKDIADFIIKLNTVLPNVFTEKSQKLLAELKVFTVGYNNGGSMAGAYGLSIYVPTSFAATAVDYKKLMFAQNSKWDEFLTAFLKVE